jgi:hypothetical protein
MKVQRLIFFLSVLLLSVQMLSCEKKSKGEKAFDDFTEKTRETGEDLKEASEETDKETKKKGKKTKKKLKDIFK